MYFDADEELRLAIKQEALKAGKSVSVLIEEILRREFPRAMEEARKVLAQRKRKDGT